MWDATGARPAGTARRAAALLLDAVLLGWLLAWLLLPLPTLPAWAALALVAGYETAGLAWRGRTVGKKAAGLVVLARRGGARLGLRRAVVRVAARLAPAVPAVTAAATAGPSVVAVLAAAGVALSAVDHGWALRDRLGRTLHDRAAGSVVLRLPRPTLFALDAEHPWKRG